MNKDLSIMSLMIAIILFFVFGFMGKLEKFQFNYEKVTELTEEVDFLENENKFLKQRRNTLLRTIRELEKEVDGIEELPAWQRYNEKY
jgi:cell division protein FtsB